MARGSTRSEEVNELTKQIIAEAVAQEYAAIGITNNVESLYSDTKIKNDYLGRRKKDMPTIGSWYRRILNNAQTNDNPDYRFHYSYLSKVMRQYIREYDWSNGIF